MSNLNLIIGQVILFEGEVCVVYARERGYVSIARLANPDASVDLDSARGIRRSKRDSDWWKGRFPRSWTRLATAHPSLQAV